MHLCTVRLINKIKSFDFYSIPTVYTDSLTWRVKTVSRLDYIVKEPCLCYRRSKFILKNTKYIKLNIDGRVYGKFLLYFYSKMS